MSRPPARSAAAGTPSPEEAPRAASSREEATPAPARKAPATRTSFLGETTLEGTALPAAERTRELDALAVVVSRCERCAELAATRTQTVFGTGSPTARLMFIGEAPGADEDRQGVPFVGRAGQLLTDMITKGMGLRREDVYIANTLKCRPPSNRTPHPDEVANCAGYLERQLSLVRPEYLCLLGRTAAQALLETSLTMGRLRGSWHKCRGIPTIVTYHPAALLRNPAWKKDTWADLQMLMKAMGLKPPARNRPGDGPAAADS